MKILLRMLTGVILVVFLVIGYNAGVNAATTTKTLVNDTRIVPPGRISVIGIPEFKKGTTVILNEKGEVMEGTLTSYTDLPCVGGAPFYYGSYFANDQSLIPNRILNFKPGTKVTFNEKGEVTKGTINGAFVFIPIDLVNTVWVQDGTEVSFHENGVLSTGILHTSTYFRPLGWVKFINENNSENLIAPGFVLFKGGAQIAINDKGEVIKGTLNNDTKLISSSGNIKVYEAGTTVEFDDNGVVVKAIK
ncbi:MAG: hypothetical protein H6Q74_2843 [Firmicutes bacterium]|nr:hypothetical protein [Bacillota bacterium]